MNEKFEVTPNYDRLMQLSTMFNQEGQMVMARVFAAFNLTAEEVDRIIKAPEGTMAHWGYTPANITGRIDTMYEAPVPTKPDLQLIQSE